MDCVTDPFTVEIVMMFSAQVGKTEILLNVTGYFIDQDPSPILNVQPTLDMADAYSKDRLSPMIRDTKVLRDKMGGERSRDSGSTILHKQFPGGHLTLAGANSAASLASRPIRIVLADEVDRYPVSAGTARQGDGKFTGEGDPLALAEKRTTNFWNRKIIKVSTPTVKDISRIEMAFKESDQRYYYVPCAHCGEMQTLKWQNVHWPDKTPDDAAYYCAHCGARWSESERLSAIKNGKWRATQPFAGIAGFHLSAMYSPWVKLSAIASEFLRAKEHPERLKTWVNTVLGETWEEFKDAKDPEMLKARAEDYDLATAPAEAMLFTCGVDVQGDRLEAYTWGYGRKEEAWALDYRAFYGDPARPLVWEQLLEHLSKPIKHALGSLVVPRTVAIDSGGLHTQTVYSFCRVNASRMTEFGGQQIIAVKGQSQAGKTIMGKPTAQDIDLNGNKIEKGVMLWPVGSSNAKQLIYARLSIEAPGPGFIHTTKAMPEDFWQQLIAERMVTKYVRGYPVLEWHMPKGKRNEALDCAVYAYAAAVQLGLPRVRDIDWDRMRDRLTVANVKPNIPDEQAEAPAPLPSKVRTAQQFYGRQPGGNFTTGWRRK